MSFPVKEMMHDLQLTEEQANQVNGLVEGTLDPEDFSSVQEWVRQCYHSPRHDELVMCALNEILEGFGVEAISSEDGDWIDNYHQNIIGSYVNMGDTYNATIVLDSESGEFLFTTYGDFVENVMQEASEDENDGF